MQLRAFLIRLHPAPTPTLPLEPRIPLFHENILLPAAGPLGDVVLLDDVKNAELVDLDLTKMPLLLERPEFLFIPREEPPYVLVLRSLIRSLDPVSPLVIRPLKSAFVLLANRFFLFPRVRPLGDELLFREEKHPGG